MRTSPRPQSDGAAAISGFRGILVGCIVAFVLPVRETHKQASQSTPPVRARHCKPFWTVLIITWRCRSARRCLTSSLIVFTRTKAKDSLERKRTSSFSRASETLDVSGLPPGFRGVLTVESVVRLMDIVARIELPDLSDIPDHEAMQAAAKTSWRIPGTRLEIALVSEGRQAGTYLFSPQTIVNLEEIHLRLAYLPAQQESVQAYLNGLAPYTSDTTLYGHWQNSAGTFGFLPERWSYEMPDWLKVRVFGATIWQWLAAFLCEVLGIFLIWLSWFIGGRLGAPRKLRVFATALFVMAYAASATTLLEALQIGGALLYFVGLGSVLHTLLVCNLDVICYGKRRRRGHHQAPKFAYRRR